MTIFKCINKLEIVEYSKFRNPLDTLKQNNLLLCLNKSLSECIKVPLLRRNAFIKNLCIAVSHSTL